MLNRKEAVEFHKLFGSFLHIIDHDIVEKLAYNSIHDKSDQKSPQEILKVFENKDNCCTLSNDFVQELLDIIMKYMGSEKCFDINTIIYEDTTIILSVNNITEKTFDIFFNNYNNDLKDIICNKVGMLYIDLNNTCDFAIRKPVTYFQETKG